MVVSTCPRVMATHSGVSPLERAQEDRDIHIKDYDVGLYVKWENIETSKVYGPHILHQTCLKLYSPIWTSLKVIDFYGD